MKVVSKFSWVLVTLALVACGKKEAPPPPPASEPAPTVTAPAPDLVNVPVAVTQVLLAKELAADGKATVPTTEFAPTDTIYAVVDLIGSGKAAVKATWTYHKGDKSALVNETVQDLTLAGPTASEFHVSKPGGWPAGEYRVEISVDGVSAGVQNFSVK